MNNTFRYDIPTERIYSQRKLGRCNKQPSVFVPAILTCLRAMVFRTARVRGIVYLYLRQKKPFVLRVINDEEAGVQKFTGEQPIL
jgi:hypothetical protein